MLLQFDFQSRESTTMVQSQGNCHLDGCGRFSHLKYNLDAETVSSCSSVVMWKPNESLKSYMSDIQQYAKIRVRWKGPRKENL
jgi:hypothetical protein